MCFICVFCIWYIKRLSSPVHPFVDVNVTGRRAETGKVVWMSKIRMDQITSASENCPICLNNLSLDDELLSLCGTHFMHRECVAVVKYESDNFAKVEFKPELNMRCPVCRCRGNVDLFHSGANRIESQHVQTSLFRFTPSHQSLEGSNLSTMLREYQKQL